MNHINSIVIEGIVSSYPISKKQYVYFFIDSFRYYANKGKPKAEISRFSVEAWNGFGKSIMKYVHKGDKIKIVGWLKQKNGESIIVAETIEVTGENVERTG